MSRYFLLCLTIFSFLVVACSSENPEFKETNKIIDSKYAAEISNLKAKNDALWKAYREETDFNKKSRIFEQISFSEEQSAIHKEMINLSKEIEKHLASTNSNIEQKVIIGAINARINPNATVVVK